MLKVDLGRLDRSRRVPIDAELAANDPTWTGLDTHLARPVTVHLVAERPGQDVVVRGRLEGEIETPCRRCLRPVRAPFGEEVTFLYRSGLGPAAAEREDAYALVAGAHELDVTEAVREHVLLSAPAFVLCREDCRGLCPVCGADRNVVHCTCAAPQGDERWAALRRLRFD